MNQGENGFEHRGGEAARLGIVAGAVVAADQTPAVGQVVVAGVGEGVVLEFQSLRAQHGLVRDLPQRQDAGMTGQRRQFGGEVTIAFADFTRFRFVGRRQAFHRVGDAATGEDKAIVGRQRLRGAGVTEFVQGLVQQHTGEIAGEGPTATVGAVHAWRETDDQQIGRGVAKGGHRAGMVIGVAGAHFLEKRGETRTGAAVGVEFHRKKQKRPTAGASIVTYCPVQLSIGPAAVCM